jgi:hypothetical protein
MTRAELEMATERVVSVCRGLRGPDDAFDVLGMAMQVIACLTEPDRDAALARLTNVIRQTRKELADNYDKYITGLKEAQARMEQWQKLNRSFVESVTVWLEGEPDADEPRDKSGDKTKH